MMNVEEQIADIRERVAAIETQLSSLQRSLDNMVGGKNGGNVVIPVAAVVSIAEIIRLVMERSF